jgi:UDP-hydrolysing UDP-N-acetyl-D-glucosamine 2-epimerase
VTTTRRVLAVTGSRAEYGLLRPVLAAIETRPALDLHVVVAGAHLLPPAHTIEEVRRDFEIAAAVEMQRPGEHGREADATALGRGVSGIAALLPQVRPDVCLVLGDRIEAFAAASAAAVAGVHVAHLHGGDRAEGIADEGMRHAITKLAHLHLPATPASAARIERLGEPASRICMVGSPAVDGLAGIGALEDDAYASLGEPEIIVLLHGCADPPDVEYRRAADLLAACTRHGRVLALEPNHDPGRAAILDAIAESGVRCVDHLPRPAFVGLLRRARLLAGNSSAGLIEAAVIGRSCLNVGRRQDGRERAGNVIDVAEGAWGTLEKRVAEAVDRGDLGGEHPYGDGHTGERVAEVLATFDLAGCPVVKRNTY